jgi:hypothetical protein
MKLNPRSQQPPPRRRLVSGAFSIAVLFLATGAAHARPVFKWQCGKITVSLHESSVMVADDERYGSLTFEPHLPVRRDDQPGPRRSIHFAWDLEHYPTKETGEPGDYPVLTGGRAFLNGKRCKDYVYVRTKDSE